MMLRQFILALLLVSFLRALIVVHAGQVFTIPEGVTEYGPIPVQALHRFAEMSFVRSSKSGYTQATFTFFHSTDGGKTFASQWFCLGVHTPDSTTDTISRTCPYPPGTTHIKVVADVEGGSIVIQKTPNVRSK